MRKGSQFQAVPLPDGNFNLRLVAANGEVLFNDRQGRPFGNLKRDLARIKRAAANAKFKVMDYPVDQPEPGNAVISPDIDPVYPT